MAASSLQDLLNFEVHFESAAETFLEASTGISAYGTINESTLITPRLEISLQMDQAAAEHSLRGGGSDPTEKDFTQQTAAFLVRVLTDNAVGQAPDHAIYRSKVRTALLYSAANWDNTTLPYYDLKWLQPGQCSYLTDEDFNITEMLWNVTFEIRRDAWPS